MGEFVFLAADTIFFTFRLNYVVHSWLFIELYYLVDYDEDDELIDNVGQFIYDRWRHDYLLALVYVEFVEHYGQPNIAKRPEK